MGNQTSPTPKLFIESQWQVLQRHLNTTVWQNKSQPSMRLQSHIIYTQDQDELSHEHKIFELRRQNPLLAAAQYLQQQANDQFCSSYQQHIIFLERLPIRLSDIEHIPFPDYLHLYDSLLKGYAQLARAVGYFNVDEGMVGINEKGMAKAWLNEDFSYSRIPTIKITEQNMVQSLLEAIQRSIDNQDLPPSAPSVHSFLYSKRQSLNFTTAIQQFAQFIRQFNYSQVPINLNCIQAVGGVYAIANRPTNQLARSNVSNKQNRISSVKVIQPADSKIVEKKLIMPLPTYHQNVIPPFGTRPISIVEPFTPLHQTTLPNRLQATQKTISVVSGSKITSIKNSQLISLNHSPQVMAGPSHSLAHRASNGPKFTVEVIPGKVYPQKSSTIFLQGSSKAVEQTLDNIQPISLTSQKIVNDVQPREEKTKLKGLLDRQSSQFKAKTVINEPVGQEGHEQVKQKVVEYRSSEDKIKNGEEASETNYFTESVRDQYQEINPIAKQTEVAQKVLVQNEAFNNQLLLSFNPAEHLPSSQYHPQPPLQLYETDHNDKDQQFDSLRFTGHFNIMENINIFQPTYNCGQNSSQIHTENYALYNGYEGGSNHFELSEYTADNNDGKTSLALLQHLKAFKYSSPSSLSNTDYIGGNRYFPSGSSEETSEMALESRNRILQSLGIYKRQEEIAI